MAPDGRSCSDSKCGPREKLTSTGDCIPCDDYERQDPANEYSCRPGPCGDRFKLIREGTCTKCLPYER